MSPRESRRSLLRATGLVTATGLAGCWSRDGTSGTTAGGPTTYGFEVVNRLTASDFQETDELSGPRPATVDLRVGPLDPGAGSLFEQTVEVASGDSTVVSDAFTVEPDGPTYAVNAELAPFVEGGLSSQRIRKHGITFTFDERPTANPIPVVVKNLAGDRESELAPGVEVEDEPLQE